MLGANINQEEANDKTMEQSQNTTNALRFALNQLP